MSEPATPSTRRTPLSLLVPFGTRPEIVKLAPVVTALRAAGGSVRTLATGQHTDPGLADAFFSDLALEPDVRWDLATGSESARVGAMLTAAFDELARTPRPDAVLLLGDTYTVPLFALAARRHRIPVVHLEAGLRSFNAESVEEGNRRAVAGLASFHLAPTTLAAKMLEAEGVPSDRVAVVGNPVTDGLRRFGPDPIAPTERHGIVVTAHRATNVDDPARLRTLVELVTTLGRELGPVRFPLHPRTHDRLQRAGLIDAISRAPGVLVEPPLRYAQMLDAIANARVIVTDSGGLQEEAAWFGVPVVVLRRSTPRWEGVLAGTSTLTGLDAARAVAATRAFAEPAAQRRAAAAPCPYGDGHVGPRVASVLSDPTTRALMAVTEPDLTGTLPRPVAEMADLAFEEIVG
jgi:UDP-N-acetylglucosamine 2-epimerase (non-hydrolysing)